MTENIQELRPWILSRHLSLGWTPKGAWVGQEMFKKRLMADAEKPVGADDTGIRRAVNDLLG